MYFITSVALPLAAMCMAGVLAASDTQSQSTPITFTGNVPVDFPDTNPAVFVAVDEKFPITFLGGLSGWNIVDIRYAYDKVTDTGYLGINTGPCITGDADCDGDAGRSSPLLNAQQGVDVAKLDLSEFAVFVIDFGSDNTILPLNTSEVAVIGVPTGRFVGEENTLTVRAAKYGSTFPRLGFGPTIADVTVTLHNSPEGPNAAKPHLELAIHPFSRLPRALNVPWNTDIACIAFSANIGSLDDGPIGEDLIAELQNCPTPTASPTPSPTSSASPSRSSSPSPSNSPSPSSSPSITPSTSPSPTPSKTYAPSPAPCGCQNSRSASSSPLPGGPCSTIAPVPTATSTRTGSRSVTPSRVSASAGIPAAERAALMDIYNSMGGSKWVNKKNWGGSTNPCTWFGVLCSAGRVVRINMPKNGLKGTIPSSIGNLPNLIQLTLTKNSGITGSIPSTIGKLTNLIALEIREAGLTGTIPNTITALTNLENILLNDNRLTGPIPELCGFYKLRLLYLRRNDLSGTIPNCLCGASELFDLFLDGNSLTGTIPNCAWAKLEELELSSNLLEGPIPACYTGMATLHHARFSYNNLGGTFPTEFCEAKKLENLYLSQNGLTGTLPACLSGLTKLKQLYAKDNSLTGCLPPELGALTQLKFLFLNGNQFTGTIPDAWTGLRSLCRPTNPIGLVKRRLRGMEDLPTDHLLPQAPLPLNLHVAARRAAAATDSSTNATVASGGRSGPRPAELPWDTRPESDRHLQVGDPIVGCLDLSNNMLSSQVPKLMKCTFGDSPFQGNCVTNAQGQTSGCPNTC